MSVVLDAVNTFFGPSQTHLHDTPPSRIYRSSASPRHGQVPAQSERHMSDSTPRATGSTVTTSQLTQSREQTAIHDASHQASSTQRPRPASPTLEPTSRPSQAPMLDPDPADDGRSSPHAYRPRRPGSSGPRKIKVRDLEHIQSFAHEDMRSFSELRHRSRSRSRGAEDDGPQYEISEMKVEHIIEMVAGLLTKITTTNDRQHEHLHRQPPAIDAASHQDPQTSSVLAFHGKNVPSITILSYLSRIHKYCPTSYEVFLSLLVYFDRMTERVNAGPMQSLREANSNSTAADQATRHGTANDAASASADQMEDITPSAVSRTQQITPPASGSMEKAVEQGVPGTPHSRPNQPDSPSLSPGLSPDRYNLSHFFVVDSFNIHRLVIAGVTCASKFFSDIFYTNSRYAKVGGLPLPELNHLELQFLRLNDFRLSVPVEEIEAYGTMLVEFYAREVVAQHQAAQAMQMRSLSESSSDSTSTVRAVSA